MPSSCGAASLSAKSGAVPSSRVGHLNRRHPWGAARRTHRSRVQLPDRGGPIRACRQVSDGIAARRCAEHRLGPLTQGRLEAARAVAGEFMTTPQWRPSADGFVFTGCGRQSIAAAVSSLVPVGGRLGVEAITYATIKSIAGRLGVSVVPIAMDTEGVSPDAIAKTHRAGALSALYLQPVLHNPIGHSMSAARREEITKLAARLRHVSHRGPRLWLPERRPATCSFLRGPLHRGRQPLETHRPRHRRRLSSRSREIEGAGHNNGARGRMVGFVACARPRLRLMADGTAAEITRLKRADARHRQAIVAKCLSNFELQADPRSYHTWLHLPDGWRSEAFVAAAARCGISITPSSAFTVAPGHAPNAVRLALGLPTHDSCGSPATGSPSSSPPIPMRQTQRSDGWRPGSAERPARWPLRARS